VQTAPIVVQIGNATAIEIGIEDIMDEDTMTATATVTVIVTVVVIAIEGDMIPTVETAVATPADGGHRMILVDHERLLVEETLQGKFDIVIFVFWPTLPLVTSFQSRR
jgi:hypothetical protein